MISRLAPPIIMNLNCLVITTQSPARPVSAGWSLTNLIVRVYSVQCTVDITSVEVDEIDIRCSISGGNRYQL